MVSPLPDLGDQRYVSFVTFRRSGAEVATPVWIASANKYFYVFSASGAGKIKRLRNDERVRLAPCDMRGKVMGHWVSGTAQVATDATTLEIAYRALREKYGWQMRVGDFFSKLSGQYARRAMIQICLSQ